MALIPPFFLDCVVAIGFKDKDGNDQFAATGFLYGHRAATPADDGQAQFHTFLVTNRHVFDGKHEATVRFNPKAGQPAKIFSLSLKNAKGEPLWHAHADTEIDVALISINWKFLTEQGIQESFFAQGDHTRTSAAYEALGGSEGDGVFVLGFPMGLIGEVRNYVIVRSGVLARFRDCSAGASKTFLVDASVFPGNSGGPVVNGVASTGILGTQIVNAAYLLGVVSGYVTYHDVAVSQQSGRTRVIFEENSSLAIVVPFEHIESVAAAAILTANPPPPPSP